MWVLTLKSAYGPTPLEEETFVQEGLESCRANLEQRESDLAEVTQRLGREALRRRQLGDRFRSLPGVSSVGFPGKDEGLCTVTLAEPHFLYRN